MIKLSKKTYNKLTAVFFSLFFLALGTHAQVKPTVALVGGDEAPVLKEQIQTNLSLVLLEMNRISKGNGDVSILKQYFHEDAFEVFRQFALKNKAYTARKAYSPQMIQRQHGENYDIRSIAIKVTIGGTETSDIQNIVFTFSNTGKIVSVRSIIPNYDYESVISEGVSAEDSLVRGNILDFLERFRMAYNAKEIQFLEQVYSDNALIIVGSVLKKKEQLDDFMNNSLLSVSKIKLIQLSKREYLDGLKEKAFTSNSFLSVRFDSIKILRHEKYPNIYGVTCLQSWKSSSYSDKGYLFLMIDFRKPDEPVIHVRAWQPSSFEDGSFVNLYDFDIIEYK